MPARRKSPRRSKSRSRSPCRSLKRRSSGKARTSRRVTRRSSKRACLSRGAVYGAQEVEDVRAGTSDLAIKNRGVQPKGTASYRYRATSTSFCILTNCDATLRKQLNDTLTNLTTPEQIDFHALYEGTVLIFASHELFNGEALDAKYRPFTEMGFPEDKVKRLQSMDIERGEQGKWEEKCFQLLTSEGVLLPVLPNEFKDIVNALMTVQNGEHRVHHVIIVQNCDSKSGTYDEESIFWRSSAWSANEPYYPSHHYLILKPMIKEAITMMCKDKWDLLTDIQKRATTRSTITRILNIGEVTTPQQAIDVLGVTTSDTEECIKRVFRDISRSIHPDKTRELGANEAFQILAAAREMLLKSDPPNR